MISLALKQALVADPQFAGIKSIIFCERGRGEKNVLLRTTTAHQAHPGLTVARYSNVQITIRGFKPSDAIALGEKIGAACLGIAEVEYATEAGKFFVYGVDLLAFPTIVYEGEDQIVSMNLEVYYQYSS